MCDKLGGIHDDLHLLLAATVNAGCGDARYAFELRLDEVFDVVEQRVHFAFVRIVVRAFQDEPGRCVGRRVDGSDDGFVRVVGVVRNLLEPVADLQPERRRCRCPT